MAYIQMMCLEPTRFSTKVADERKKLNKNRFSASYGGTKENFIVNFSIEHNDDIDIDKNSIFCVIQNILQRGRFVTPSSFLQEKLGELYGKPVPLIKKYVPQWDNIKGDDKHHYYPAQTFFYNILPQYLGDYSFVQGLILPEADFRDILHKTTALNGQQVDFYLPQVNLVIEIDGSSHTDTSQIQKDQYRDRCLRAEGIQVVRIKTDDIANKTELLDQQMQQIVEIVRSSDVIAQYREALLITDKDKRIRYDAVMRLELAFLAGFRSGKLSLNASELKIKIVESDVSDLKDLLYFAYQDLEKWAYSISELAKIDLHFPKLDIVQGNEPQAINLSFSMFKRYVDTDIADKAKNTIYIRTAYIPQADYYQVATSVPLKYKFKTDSFEEENKNLKYIMQNLFGHKNFRDGQLPVIKNALRYEDTIGILPTGTGKSMCYQMAALLQPGVSLVVVPIISLMQDQKKGMDNRNINRVAYISSAVLGDERERIMKDFEAGKYQFMLISPERTQNQEFIDVLQSINKRSNFAYGVIDEVHCLSEWGHDFRVSYLRLIPTLRKYCNNLCLIGLTATASQAVLDDLKAEFNNDGSGIVALASMDRKELEFKRIPVKSQQEREQAIENIIKDNEGTYTDSNHVEKNSVGLIFCPTVRGKNRPSCQHIAQLLQDDGMKDRVLIYHGKTEILSNEEKMENQRKFMEKDFSGVMVCTSAFGMGIDKENIKYTIHASLPKSIESFFQEAGRAGRDEDKTLKSHCYILYQKEKNDKSENFLKIFNANTNMTERKKLSGILNGDLSTTMFFWNTNRTSFDEDYKQIQKILHLLNIENQNVIPFDNGSNENKLTDIQNALYRLALLRIIDGWTIRYIGGVTRGTVTINGNNGIDAEQVKKALVAYIQKHDAEFNLDGKSSRYEKYFKMLTQEPDKPIKNLVRILLTWVSDNILYNRLQSIYNMYQLCSKDVSDADFRKRIVDYFRYTEDSVVFEEIIQNPLNYQLWFNLLAKKSDKEDKLISEEQANSLLSALLRYLESYGQNTGLNYLSGVLRLIVDDFEGTEGEWRLQNSFKYIAESMDTKNQEEIINKTIVIGKTLSTNNQNNLSKVLLHEFPNLDHKLYEEFQDDYSLATIVNHATLRLRNTLEDDLKWIM